MLRVYTLLATLQTFLTDRFEDRKDRGATAVEYGLLVGLIAAVIIIGVSAFGDQLGDLFKDLADWLPEVGGKGVATNNG